MLRRRHAGHIAQGGHGHVSARRQLAVHIGGSIVQDHIHADGKGNVLAGGLGRRFGIGLDPALGADIDVARGLQNRVLCHLH